MSFYWTKKITKVIVYFLEEGKKTQREIAYLCNCSIKFVRKTAEKYDELTANDTKK